MRYPQFTTADWHELYYSGGIAEEDELRAIAGVDCERAIVGLATFTPQQWLVIQYALEAKLALMLAGHYDDSNGEIGWRGSRTHKWATHLRRLIRKVSKLTGNLPRPRALTPEEVRTKVLDHMHALVEYWAEHASAGSVKDRLNGLAFSILNIFDGTSADLPAFNLVCQPHPDDRSYCIQHGENWYEGGTIVNNDVLLHEVWYQTKAGKEKG